VERRKRNHAKSKAKKEKQLNMKLGTANSRMRKALLFHLARNCDMHFCFQCGTEIEHIEEFSIEHKEPWLDSNNPISLYFDVNNLAFSHLDCNIRAQRRPNRKYNSSQEASKAQTVRRRESRRNETPEKRERRLARRRAAYKKKKLES
jgi:hypothetical protein